MRQFRRPDPSTARPSAAPAFVRWGAAVLPAIPFLVANFARAELVPDVQRLALLALVAVAAALAGSGPGLLAALVATAAAGYEALPPGHWVVVAARDWIALGGFAVCAAVIALAAGSGYTARLMARLALYRLARAERTADEQGRAASKAIEDADTARAALARSDAALAAARRDLERGDQARRALIASLPDDLRAPHVAVPTAHQLFPPIFTPPPLGIEGVALPPAPDPLAPDPAAATDPDDTL